MIKDSIKMLKMTKYGFNSKSSLIFGLCFLLIGIIMMSTPGNNNQFVGCVYVTLGPMMILQVINTNLLTGIVLSSPKHKDMEIKIPTFLTAVLSLVSYTFLIGTNILRINVFGTGERTPEGIGMELVFCAGLIALMCLYLAIVYKQYLIALVLFITIMMVGLNFSDIMVIKREMPFGQYILLGYGIVIAGNILATVIRIMLYKLPMSKYAMGAIMRKMK